MNETINTQSTSEFSTGYLRWLFSLTIVVLLYVFLIQPEITKSYQVEQSFFVPSHAIAGREIVSYGIDEFNAGALQPISTDSRTSALVYLIVFLIIAPTFVLFISRSFSEEKQQQKEKTGLAFYPKIILFLSSLLLVAVAFLTTVVGVFETRNVNATMVHDNGISEERDMLTNDLVDVYTHIVQYYYQTEQFGGKLKNIVQRNSDGSILSTATLSDFGVNDKREFGTLVLDPITSDSMITVYAVGKSMMGRTSTMAANNETGKIKYAVYILPAEPAYTIRKIN